MAQTHPRQHRPSAGDSQPASAPANPSAPAREPRHLPRPQRQVQPRRSRPLPLPHSSAAADAEQCRRLNQQLFQRLQQSPAGSMRLHCRNALVCQNLALVHKLANRQSRRSGVAFEDLCSAGYEGLIRAVDTFDSRSGNAFSSYAVPHIHGAMLMDQRERQQPLQTPRRLRELQQRSLRLQEQRRAAGLVPLSAEQQAEALGCTLNQLQEAARVQLALQVRSLDQPLQTGADPSGSEAPAALAMVAAPPPADDGDDLQLSWLRQQLQQLTGEDRELLEGRWIDGLSWSALGQRFGCSGLHCRRRAMQLKHSLQAMASQVQMAMASRAAIAV